MLKVPDPRHRHYNHADSETMSASGRRDRCCTSTSTELRRRHGNCCSRSTLPPRNAPHTPLRLHCHGVPSASTLDRRVPLHPTRRCRSEGPPHRRRSGPRHPPQRRSGLRHHPQARRRQISSGVASPDPIGRRVPEPPPRPRSSLRR
jgi:hypothetical protein